ncbi:MAG TPA: hypothetical protein VII47_10215 [Actinomycetota bacterium]
MAALAAWALVPAGVASAQVAYGPGVGFVPPTPSAGTPLTGVQHVKAQATGVFIRSLHLIIRSDDPSIPAFQSQADQGSAVEQQTVEADWDTSKLTHNGVYRLEASAEVCGPAGCALISSTRAGLLVANPPATPAGVHAAFQNNVPVVSWKAGGEADLLGYEVLRSSPGGPLPVGGVQAGDPTVFTDTTAPVGVAVGYSVVAVRRSPVAAPGGGCGSFGARCTISSPSVPTPMIVTPVLAPPSPADGGAASPPANQGQTGVAPPAAPPAVQGNRAPAPPGPAAPALQQKASQKASQPSAPAAPAPQPAVPAGSGTAVPAPQAPPDTEIQGTEVAPSLPSDTTIAAHDRVDTSKPDKTAVVLTFSLLVLGFYAAYRAKGLLRSRHRE